MAYINPQFADKLQRDPRYGLSQQLLRNGLDASPVQGGGIEVLSRVLQAGLGAYQQGKLQDEYSGRSQQAAADLAAGLGQIGGRDAETKTYGDGTQINWEAQAPDMQAGIRTLAANPDLAEQATQLQLQDIESRRSLANNLAQINLQRENKLADQRREDSWRARERTTDAFGNVVPKYAPEGSSVGTYQSAPIASSGDYGDQTGASLASGGANLTQNIDPVVANSPKFRQTLAEKQLDKNLAQPKSLSAFRSNMASTENVIKNIDEALAATSNWTAGPGSILGNVPGTPARDLDATLGTIRANVGFDALQEMRNNSPTGGALGAISDAEGRRLEALKANIESSQSPDKLRKNLTDLRNQLLESQNRFRSAYQRDYGVDPLGDQVATKDNESTQLSSAPAVGVIDSGYRFLGGDPADANSWEQVQ